MGQAKIVATLHSLLHLLISTLPLLREHMSRAHRISEVNTDLRKCKRDDPCATQRASLFAKYLDHYIVAAL